MSLLDAGPHTVTVFPEETVTDSNGNPTKRPSSIGVTITGCLMAPSPQPGAVGMRRGALSVATSRR